MLLLLRQATAIPSAAVACCCYYCIGKLLISLLLVWRPAGSQGRVFPSRPLCLPCSLWYILPGSVMSPFCGRILLKCKCRGILNVNWFFSMIIMTKHIVYQLDFAPKNIFHDLVPWLSQVKHSEITSFSLLNLTTIIFCVCVFKAWIDFKYPIILRH